MTDSKSLISHNVARNLYVDNMITGVSDDEEAVTYHEETKSLFNFAPMNMRQWSSNSMLFMNRIPQEDRCNDKYVKVLGIIWNPSEDSIAIKKNKGKIKESKITKRDILRLVIGVFDPLGLFTPVMLGPKVLIQDLWKMKFK